jgi:Ca2+-binding RTX toxin-like protein
VPTTPNAQITVRATLTDGTDSLRNAGERQASLTVNLNWSSNGSSADFTMPVQTLRATYQDTRGNNYTFEFDNIDSDVISIASAGPDYPATLNLKLATLINKLSSLTPGGLLKNGDYNLVVTPSIPLVAASGATITSIQSSLKIATDPVATVFVADVVIGESDSNATLKFELSKPVEQDVVVTYRTVAGTATAGTDFTTTTGTVTIAAGLLSASINVPIISDTEVEKSIETFWLNVDSVSGGTVVAARSVASIAILDDEENVSNSELRASMASITVDQIYSDLSADFDKLVAARMVTRNGQSVTLASVLGSTATGDAIDSRKAGLKLALEAQWDAISSIFNSVGIGAGMSVADFAAALMAANSASTSFDLASNAAFSGVYVPSGTGAFTPTDNSTTRAAVLNLYTTLKGVALESIGDVLATVTKTGFINAKIVLLTTGNDTLTLSNDSEIIAAFDGTNTVYAMGGNDMVIGGSGVDNFDGGSGDDNLQGFTGNDTLTGGAGNDALNGGAGDDSLNGGAGDDQIIGGSGNDTIDTGTGSDNAYGQNGDDAVTIGGNNGQAFSTYADGGAGTNTLAISYTGVSKLSDFVSRAFINAGASTLDGSFTLVDANGGTIDFKNFGYDASNARYSFVVGTKTYYFNPIGGVFGDTLASSHASSLGMGSNKGAAYSTAGGEVALFTTTQASTSGFDGGTTLPGNPSSLQISGSTGRDLIKGSAGADTIRGNAGNDEIYAVGTGNSVYGDAGDDVIFLAATSELSSNTVLDGGAGSDTLNFITVSLGTSNTTGGLSINMTSLGVATSFENLVGDFFGDTLTGDANNNVIFGVLGNDTIYGAAGDDTLYGDWGASLADSAKFGLSQGGNYSNDGDDMLYGGAGNDILVGNGGNDLFDGGTGADTLTGGTGSDTFVLRAGDGGISISLADTITDFNAAADLLQLSGFNRSQLSITSQSGNSVIMFNSEYIAVVVGVAPSQLINSVFTS